MSTMKTYMFLCVTLQEFLFYSNTDIGLGAVALEVMKTNMIFLSREEEGYSTISNTNKHVPRKRGTKIKEVSKGDSL